MRFIQRDGEVGTVTFTGTEARLLKGGSVVVDWTSGGALRDVPQGDGYTLEVRSGGAVLHEDVAIGVLVLALGQSNIERWFNGPTARPVAAGTYQLGDDGWGEMEGAGGRTFSARLAGAIGAPVAVINVAVGNTALVPEADDGRGYWLDTAPGSLYAAAMAQVDAAGSLPELVLWSQGGREASAGVSGARYGAALEELLGRLAEDLGDPVVLLSELPRHAAPAKEMHYAEIRAVQAEIAAAHADVHLAGKTADLELVDLVHLSPVGYGLNAYRMANYAAKNLYEADVIRRLSKGTDGADELVGGNAEDRLEGHGGDDRLIGRRGDDLLFGADGDDWLDGGPGNDIVRGGNGADQIFGGEGSDMLGGGEGDDRLEGRLGNDEIAGDQGDDIILGGQGDDVIHGGEGFDVAVYNGFSGGFAWRREGDGIRVTDVLLADGDEGVDFLRAVEVLRFADGDVLL